MDRRLNKILIILMCASVLFFAGCAEKGPTKDEICEELIAQLSEIETLRLEMKCGEVWPLTDDEYAIQLAEKDLSEYTSVNADVYGWIWVPGTELDYPLMKGTNGDYYLTHTWRGNYNEGGSIFLEHLCSQDMSDFNTLVYGHRMSSVSNKMFGSLKHYAEQDYFNEHPYVYFRIGDVVRRYSVFAAEKAPINAKLFWVTDYDEDHKQQLIDYAVGNAQIKNDIVPTVYDKIVTLVTCTGGAHTHRWTVQTVLRGESRVEELISAN